MNALLELLASDADVSTGDVRAATAATISRIKGDTRVRVFRDQQDLYGLVGELAAKPDMRLLDVRTNPITELTWNFEKAFQERPHGRYIFNVTDPRVIDDPMGVEYQSLVRAASEVRLKTVPFRVQVYDRSCALIPLDFDDNMVGAYLTTEPDLVRGLLELHRRMWVRAERDIDHVLPPSPQTFSWSSLLAQLVSGRTDEAGARAIGTTLRTYRRRVQVLMSDLGVASRFAAGVEAQRRGLLDLIA